jgi:predicted Rossmann fold nucleotide-binding protein DprA/Smf involved in DNA uptake
MTIQQRREWAYWLTLAFRLERESRRTINGLVLTADRKVQLGLLDLVRMTPADRPREIEKYAATLDRLLEADGKVSAQAFVIDRLLSMGCRLVPITDRAYPPHLAHRIGPDRAPTVLTTVGSEELWKTAGVAISGSRKSGPSGLAFARAAGRAVAEAGEVVVCGLAAGVDREALEGALEAGGRVLGIAPEGLFHSRWLRRREVDEGRLAVVSEFAPDDRWSAGRAMGRNRTIAGFSSALVIADCVASGGTTDQLEVHRAAGLKVYVRRGPGQGALVEELCRRPGVTPWLWSAGPVIWPPQQQTEKQQTETASSSDAQRAECVVTLSSDRVQIKIDAPRQLNLETILDEVRIEYRRAIDTVQSYPTLEPLAAVGRVSESTDVYAPAPPDLVLAELDRAASKGASTREIEQATGVSTHRVRKRLKELLDAGLIAKSGNRYFKQASDIEVPSVPKRKPGLRSKKSAVETAQALFSEMDLQAHRTRS